MAKAQLKNVYKSFGTTEVLTDINLCMEDGAFTTFVGPSGSGKSTLLRVISGLESVSSGKVFIGDRDVTEEPPKKRSISMVFQNYALYPHMSVAKNITFGMRIRKESKANQKRALERVTKTLKLDGLLDRKPRMLSGGQRQRVAMARAIVHTPDLFLMDEPLSNLDAKLRNDVRLSIMKLQKELGCTMVYVTHDQIEAMTMADQIVVLNEGKIQQIGSPQELYHNPTNLFSAGFIGTPAMNFLALNKKDQSFCLSDGTPTPLPGEIKQKISTTKNITLGLRPEHLFCSEAECLTAINGKASRFEQKTISLKRTINSTEMLGSEFLVHTDKNEEEIQYRQANSGFMPKEGETVELYFSPSCIHFFNGDTGQRIEI